MKYLLKLLSLLAPSLFIFPVCAEPTPTARLAIIIDDLGNSLTQGLDAIALPGNITFAVMPHRKYSNKLAQRAGRLGKQVLLHAPMSTVNHRKLGPGALHEGLNEKQLKDRLRFAIHSIPFISGVNNHMGSLLTTQSHAMTWVMEVLKEKELFFVDSRTSAQSQGYEIALRKGIDSAKRDIFLDHELDIDHIHQQFKKALTIAQKYGSAIAIGHPHDSTLFYLNKVLPQLEGSEISLHSVSELLDIGTKSASQFATNTYLPPHVKLDQLVQQLSLPSQH
ncbi:MAG: divergent polysaccharide deacetylase family protein [Bermanella sp.]